MRVIVYVEGPSDKLAMQELLRPLLALKAHQGVAVDFFETTEGDRKASLLVKAPVRAANILANDPEARVVIMPDLYPRNKAFAHETFPELAQGIRDRFESVLEGKGWADRCLGERLHVFCFKYDLEALVLAAELELADRLGVSSLQPTWSIPVEDQDHARPPKRIVEELFARYHKRYRDTVDAPAILGRASYTDIAARCPQCFERFVNWLADLDSEPV